MRITIIECQRFFYQFTRTPLPALCLLRQQNNITFSMQFVRKVCRTSGDQTLAKQWLLILKNEKKHGGGASLWSQVVAPAHARCVFYCFLIIVGVLLGRIYWSRQPARLQNAYEVGSACVTAMAVRRGEGPYLCWAVQKILFNSSCCMPVGSSRCSGMLM